MSRLEKSFIEKYDESAQKIEIYFAPGRVNLIGEHTDYNGGYVFPCTIDKGTYLAVRRSDDINIKFKTLNFEFSAVIDFGDLDKKKDSEWVNYPLGVIGQLKNKGLILSGLELLYYGNIPNGAGLSSSASIELVTAFALNDMFSLQLNRMELVKLCQKAENEFVGMNCGIMDQFAVGMGKENTAIFLDCDTLDFELVPINLKDYKVIISNTNKTRKLTDSKYNERRSECETALEIINKQGKIFKNLGKVSSEEFQKLENTITDNTIRKRARHVISESHRVIKAVEYLKKSDLNGFGKLMIESHNSLKNDYEVTGIELDTLVEEALKIKGVSGSRMTGAGFGGCTVSIVENDSVDGFIEQVGKNYKLRTGLYAEFYIAEIKDGVRKIKNQG